MAMTYKQFHEAWQGIPDKFFKHMNELIFNSTCDDHRCTSCFIAKFISDAISIPISKSVSLNKNRWCPLCMLRINDYGCKNIGECFNELHIILYSLVDMSKVRLLAYAIYARERLHKINTREWYDFIQQRDNNNDSDSNNDIRRSSAVVD